MAELRWRDNALGRETLFPWSIPDGRVITVDPMVKETPAGKAVLFTDVLPDEGVAIALTYPGGARFARISPETGWALEERKEGTTPPAIAEEMDSAWRETLTLFAARNKELRSATLSDSEQGED